MYSAKWRILKDVMEGKQCLNKRSAKLIRNVFFLKCFLRLNGIPESKCNPKVRQNSGVSDSETKYFAHRLVRFLACIYYVCTEVKV